MHTRLALLVVVVLLVGVAFVAGCGKKADENRPVADMRVEAEKMDAATLRENAKVYKDALQAKMAELNKVKEQIKPDELLTEKGIELQKKSAEISASIGKLRERLQVYLDQLAKKGEDITDLKVN